MAEPAPDQPVAAPVRRQKGWLSWLILFVVATTSISLAAVYLPPRIKMLGLFAIGQGLLAGWVAARLAAACDFPAASRGVGAGLVFLVILGGQVATAVESHRLYRAAQERSLAEHPKRAAVLRMLQAAKLPDDAKSSQVAEEVRRTIGAPGTSFADYLRFRVSETGVQSRGFAETIWVLEIGLGSLAGSWILHRLAPAARLEASEPPAKLE